MIGLTPQQRRTLDIICSRTVDGVPPTFDEIRTDLGLASKSGVHRLLNGLQERGAITYVPGRGRSIRVLDDVEGLELRTTGHLRAIRNRIDAILQDRGQ